MKINPFFSIIVVCYNAEDLISVTLDSILQQTLSDFEIIVKDGLSTDNTLGKIPVDSRIELVVKSDAGIYDAMNQAVGLASGKFVQFLNCGDTFHDKDVLEIVYQEALKHLCPCVIYGNLMRDDGVSTQERRLKELSLYRNPLNHQTCFVSKKLFDQFGMFDLSFKILADYEFTLRTWFSGVPYFYIDKVLINYMGGGFSVAKNNIVRKNYEFQKIRRKYFHFVHKFLYDLIICFSLRHLRSSLDSSESPLFARQIYRGIVSSIIRLLNY